MKNTLGGLFVPIPTPFDPVTEDVAPVPLRSNTRALLDQGIAGILAAGSTGEASHLSEAEFRQVVGWLRDLVPDTHWLLAGAGRESTRATIDACRAAAAEEADAVLVRPPAYYGPQLDHGALVDHFRRVADESPIPVLLYNIPKYTHLSLHEAVITAMAEHTNVIGAKDSSGDLKNFAAYRAGAPQWALFMGSGSHYYAALELGAVGGILAVASFAAPLAVTLDAAFRRGDTAEAGAIQERLAPLNKAVVGETGVPGIKAAMDLVGLAGGLPRHPLQPVSAATHERIARALADAGVGNAAD